MEHIAAGLQVTFEEALCQSRPITIYCIILRILQTELVWRHFLYDLYVARGFIWFFSK